MNGVTHPPYRFMSLAEAAEYAGVTEREIRAVCRITRDRVGEYVSELELIRQLGIKRKL